MRRNDQSLWGGGGRLERRDKEGGMWIVKWDRRENGKGEEEEMLFVIRRG